MRTRLLANKSGFTLLEMVIVMLIFVVVILITSEAFKIVLTKTKAVGKSEESNIEGVVGLEMFRHDLEQAGYGLFTEADLPLPVYAEANAAPASNYNDATSGIPRAVVGGNGDNVNNVAGVLAGTDYLAIKATSVGLGLVSQKWTYINGVAASRVWGVNDLIVDSEYVIAVKQSYQSGELSRKLIYKTTAPSTFSTLFKANAAGYASPFGPVSDSIQYYYYGIDTINPRAPFNRTDYMVRRPANVPSNCAPGAGVLYKTVMNQTIGAGGGGMTDIPIMDCVADMQVVFGWNVSSPAGLDATSFSNADASTVVSPGSWTPAFTDPTDIRKHLKLIKIYILAQDGGYDKDFINTNPSFMVGSGTAGELNLTRTIDLRDAKYQNYRWKLYRIVVKPKNLI